MVRQHHGPWMDIGVSPDGGPLMGTTMSPGWMLVCLLDGHHHVHWMDTTVSPDGDPLVDPTMSPRWTAIGALGGHHCVP